MSIGACVYIGTGVAEVGGGGVDITRKGILKGEITKPNILIPSRIGNKTDYFFRFHQYVSTENDRAKTGPVPLYGKRRHRINCEQKHVHLVTNCLVPSEARKSLALLRNPFSTPQSQKRVHSVSHQSR